MPPPASLERERLGASDRSLDLDEEVTRSLAAIERTVESFGSLKNNVAFYKDMSEELQQHVNEEKERAKDALRHLAEVERLAKSERDRANTAEAVAEKLGVTVADLEGQLGKLRSQTARLAKAVSLLLSEADELSDFGERGVRSVAAPDKPGMLTANRPR